MKQPKKTIKDQQPNGNSYTIHPSFDLMGMYVWEKDFHLSTESPPVKKDKKKC